VIDTQTGDLWMKESKNRPWAKIAPPMPAK
jgi:hypothetical protein